MISDNINAKAEDIHKEAIAFEAGEINSTPIATEVREKSAHAIVAGQFDGGKPNTAWVEYMRLFAKDGTELDRLVPNDGTLDDDRQQARSYLVANGMCSMGTGSRLANGVGTRLD